MIFRPDRRRRGVDRTLLHRMALFGIGAVLALAGILWSRNSLVTAAIVILVVAMLLGVLGRRGGEEDEGA